MRRWFNIALLNFGIAALIGCVLRAIYIWEIPFIRFKPLLNAHSHVAMLGWAFIAMVVFLLQDETEHGPSRRSNILLAAAQIAVVGMLLGFPVQSYGAFTITVSVLHMLAGYWLSVQVWKATRTWRANGSRLLTRMAVILMFISTIGIWAMGPIRRHQRDAGYSFEGLSKSVASGGSPSIPVATPGSHPIHAAPGPPSC